MLGRGPPRHGPTGPQPPGLSAPIASPLQIAFPHCVHDALAAVQKHVRIARGRQIPNAAAKMSEIQNIVDQQIFCLSEKRCPRISEIQQFQLIAILAEFFNDRKDDIHKYTFFEIIFLGRERDLHPDLHNSRIQILFRLASFAAEYPVYNIFVQICQWLSKPVHCVTYGESLISLLVEHYLKNTYDETAYEFLLPIESVSADFCVLFLTFAPRPDTIGAPLVAVCGSYLLSHPTFIANSYRDTPELSKIFCTQSFHLLLDYVLKKEGNDDLSLVDLHDGLMKVLDGWKDRDNVPNLELVLSDEMPWSCRRMDVVLLSGGSGPVAQHVKKITNGMKIPYVDELHIDK